MLTMLFIHRKIYIIGYLSSQDDDSIGSTSSRSSLDSSADRLLGHLFGGDAPAIRANLWKHDLLYHAWRGSQLTTHVSLEPWTRAHVLDWMTEVFE